MAIIIRVFYSQNASFNGVSLNHSFSGGGPIGSATLQHPASTMRPPPQQHFTRSVPADMSREQFLGHSQQQHQHSSVPNDYVQLPTVPRTAEEPPVIVEDHRLPQRPLGRYVCVVGLHVYWEVCALI